MAPTTIISMVSALLFLPIALCRPLEVPSGLLPEKSSESVSPPTNYRTGSFAHVPTLTLSTAPSRTCTTPLGRPWYPEGCTPIDPSCWHAYPTSWICSSGVFPPLPTPTHPTGNPTSHHTGSFPTATGIPPTGIAPTTGTASPLPTATLLNKREADQLAVKKRRAFEGPRHRHFPHSWPHYSAAVPVVHFMSIPTGQPLQHVSETAFPSTSTGEPLSPVSSTASPSGTGAGARPTGWISTGTAPMITWPWATDRLPTPATSVLTMPVESGIGGMV